MFIISLSQLFLEWEVFKTKYVEEIKTHILCSVTFFVSSIFYNEMWINIVDDNMAHKLCILDN
jgi:hypothetical protein